MPKRIWFALSLASIALMAGILAAAEDPFIGTWKLNPAKSKFTGDSLTFEKTAGGMRWSAAGESYEFKMDGADAPAVFGYTAAWKQVTDRTWETANKLGGKLLSTDYLTLSADGKTLTMETKGTKPDGTSYADSTVYKRETGTDGLPGKWRNKQVKISAPGTMEFSAFEGGGLTWKSVEFNTAWKGKLDEKDYPVSGPTVGEGFTMSMKRLGPRTIEYTEKNNGKAIYRGTLTVSAAGKTLTHVGSPIAVHETTTAVFDRR